MKKNLFDYFKSHKLISMLIVILIISGVTLGPFYFGVQQRIERENIELDEYNFRQLEKIKSILAEIPREEYTFRNLKDFNKKLNQDITPKKFCYYLVATKYFEDEKYTRRETDYKSELGYIFGTKIYSNHYLKKYPEGYLAYPKYDLPEFQRCRTSLRTGEPFCYDETYSIFQGTLDGVCLN